jgi:uncharacterized glyoxalase superfamily protein PhnB
MQARQVVPILNVSNISDSFAWFAKLGWTKNWDWCARGEVPSFGSVGSGKVEMFLCLDGQGGRGPEHGTWVAIMVDDVDAVHATCIREGLEVTFPPTDEPWGLREMHVRHPDGHVFRIGSHPHDHDHPHDHAHEPDHEHPHPHPHPHPHVEG